MSEARPDCASDALTVSVVPPLVHPLPECGALTELVMVGAVVSTLVVTVAVLVLPTASVAVIVYVVLPDGGVIGPVTGVAAPPPIW